MYQTPARQDGKQAPMAIFEVYLPERAIRADSGGVEPAQIQQSLRADDLMDVRFLGDRVSLLALVFPAIWLVWHRLWWAFAAYLIFAFAIAGLGMTDFAAAMAALSFLPGIYVFLEGANLIADKWQRSGYVLAGLVEADALEDAELRWFFANGPGARPMQNPFVARANLAGRGTAPQSAQDRPEFGLFAED